MTRITYHDEDSHLVGGRLGGGAAGVGRGGGGVRTQPQVDAEAGVEALQPDLF